MTLRPRRSFTVTIFIAVTRVFSLALSLAILRRAKAEAFLAAHFDDIGERSSTDIATKFF